MRAIAVLFGVLLAVALPVTRAYAASDEQRVDPYERLYGRAMARHRALEPNELSLAPEAARKMAERTQALLTREAAASLPGGLGGLPPKMQAVMAKLDENAQRSRQLLQEGRYEAAYLEATEYAFLHTLLVHVFVGIQRVAQSGSRTDGAALAALPSRLPEARSQLERIHQELQKTTPKTASQLVALLAAYASWHDTEVLLDLAEHHPDGVFALLKSEFSIDVSQDPDAPELFMRLVVEPFVLTAISEMGDDVRLRLKLSRIDSDGDLAPLARRIDEAQVKQLATAYGEAARWNFGRLEAVAAGRTLPRENALETAIRLIENFTINARIQYEKDHKDEAGRDAAYKLLAANVQSYVDSLYSLATLRVRLADAASLAGNEGTATATTSTQGDEVLTRLLQLQSRLARTAGGGARAEIGYVPTPVALLLRGGTDSNSGDRDDRKRALGELILAGAYADLARALSTPPPCPEEGSATCQAGPTVDESKELWDCISQLRGPELGLVQKAQRFAQGRRSAVPAMDVEDMIADAILDTCLEADDRGERISGLFWAKFKSRIADWYSDVVVEERNAPRFFDACPTRPDDDLQERETEAEQAVRGVRTRKVLCDLDPKDRQILELHINQRKSFPQIGFQLGMTPDAVRQRFNRAKAAFRKTWGRPPDFSWLQTENLRMFASL
mgnify:CR=1 FL=1